MNDQQMPNGFADNYGEMPQNSAQTGGWQPNQNQYAQPQQDYRAYAQGGQQNPYANYTGYQAGQMNPYGQQANNAYQAGQPNPYAQQPYAPQGGYNGYNQPVQNGYQQPQNPNPYQQQAASPYAQYVQQQGQNAWQQPGYQQQPYQQAQNLYGQQMPPVQQPYAQQPYQAYPPYQPVPPTADVHQASWSLPVVLIAVSALVVLLFVIALIVGAPVMKWIAAIVAVLGVAAIWLIPDAAEGYVRLGATAGYAVIAILCVVLALTSRAPADPSVSPNGTPAPSDNYSGVGTIISDIKTPNPLDEEGIGDDWDTAVTDAPVMSVPAEVNELDGDCARQLKTFFSFWSVNDTETMVTLCAPSWQKGVNEPKKALFSILSNRSPVNYELQSISGTDQDASRIITVEAEIDKRNGNATSIYRFKVVMLRENENWYVDPRSLESSEAAATATATNAFPTQPPQPEPATPDTKLYYNEDGGHYYHADANCSKVGSKYRPLKGTFRYSQINDAKFKDLYACPDCGAPLRNQ